MPNHATQGQSVPPKNLGTASDPTSPDHPATSVPDHLAGAQGGPVGGNPNWAACPTCGQNLLLDPVSKKPQACPYCESSQQRLPLAVGVVAIATGVALMIAAVAVGLWLLW